MLGREQAAVGGDADELERDPGLDERPMDGDDSVPIEERLAAVMRDNGLECRDADTFNKLLRLLDADMKATTRTINRLREELEAGTTWASKYEREYGPFKMPPPDHLIGF